MEHEIFSKRQQRIQDENLNTYQYKTIPDQLRVQIFYIWEKVWGTAYENNFGELQLSPLAIDAYTSIETTLREEYGVLALDGVDDPDEDGYGFYWAVRDFLFKTEDRKKVDEYHYRCHLYAHSHQYRHRKRYDTAANIRRRPRGR